MDPLRVLHLCIKAAEITRYLSIPNNAKQNFMYNKYTQVPSHN